MQSKIMVWLAFCASMALLYGYSENWLSILLLISGAVILYYSAQQRLRTADKPVKTVAIMPFVLGGLLVLFSLMLLPNFWLIFLFIIIAYIGYDIYHHRLKGKASSPNKTSLQYVAITEPTMEEDVHYSHKFFDINSWFFGQHQGKETFPWENFQYYSLFGDSLIDFTNTIVPRKTNVIGIHKAVGNIKLVVPAGTGVSLHLNSYRSTLRWQGQHYAIENEKFIMENEAYQSSPRKIHITITQGWGNVEVVFL